MVTFIIVDVHLLIYVYTFFQNASLRNFAGLETSTNS